MTYEEAQLMKNLSWQSSPQFVKIVVSFFAGFALATAITFFYIVPRVKENWRAQGEVTATLRVNRKVHMIAEKYFPENLPVHCEDVVVLAGAKPDTTWIVDCGGYKTLRVTK